MLQQSEIRRPQPAPFEVICDSSDREFWLKQRQLTIGASEAAAVFGRSPWTSLLELWAVKTGRMAPKDLDDVEAVFWGNELEPGIISGFGKRTGRAALPFGLLLRSDRFPVLSATPDGLTTDDPEAAKRGPAITACILNLRAAIHAKQPLDALTHDLRELAVGWWPLQIKNIGFGSAEHWSNGIPDYYTIQCSQEALVWGAAKCTGAALVAGQKLVWDDIPVTNDNLMVRQLTTLTRRFWEQNIVMGIEPPPDASESAKRALAALYPVEHPELVLQLGVEELEWARQRDAKKALHSALEKEIKLLDNQLKAAIGHAEKCFFPDGSGLTLKTVNKKEYVVEAQSYRELRRKKVKGE